jgi:hypothetical protein
MNTGGSKPRVRAVGYVYRDVPSCDLDAAPHRHAKIVDIACTVQGTEAVEARAQVSAANAATIKAAVTFPARARSVTLAWTLTLTDPSADRIAIASGPLIYAATAGPDPA